MLVMEVFRYIQFCEYLRMLFGCLENITKDEAFMADLEYFHALRIELGIFD